MAAEAGADFLGFVFVPSTRRGLSEETGHDIISNYRNLYGQKGPMLVGLFADQPVEEVNRITSICGLDMAQLCGQENPDYWSEISVPLIKQIKVRDTDNPSETSKSVALSVKQVVEAGHLATLDKHEDGKLGGTGQPFDWRIATEVARDYDFLLSGGLRPDSVRDAIIDIGPWGVDVSSGVETMGVKDPHKILRFSEAVSEADYLRSTTKNRLHGRES